jgi:hypothetical protein
VSETGPIREPGVEAKCGRGKLQCLPQRDSGPGNDYATAPAPTDTDTSVSPATTYFYYVKAVNAMAIRILQRSPRADDRTGDGLHHGEARFGVCSPALVRTTTYVEIARRPGKKERVGLQVLSNPACGPPRVTMDSLRGQRVKR